MVQIQQIQMATMNPVPPSLPDKTIALRDDTPKLRASVYGVQLYFLWWIKNVRVPPLVTTGGNGVIGAPGTRIALDDLNFADDFRQGGRFTLGYRFDSAPVIGIEAGYFFLYGKPDLLFI